MSKTPQEVYQAMNATNILIAILESQKVISVPLNTFINAPEGDKNLHVEFNQETSSFVFELREKVEQQNNNENVESNTNE